MNVKELIEKYEYLNHNYFRRVDTSEVLRDLKQLDEPQKVVVPQFVADEIKRFKKTGDWDLFQAMDYCFEKNEIREWLENKDNQELFARAWLDGYEVEEDVEGFTEIAEIIGNIYENPELLEDKEVDN